MVDKVNKTGFQSDESPEKSKLDDKPPHRGGRRRVSSGGQWPDPDAVSILVDETSSMMREQRNQEQQGHRSLARVNERNHTEREQNKVAPEGEPQNSILQHPDLDGQRFDGVDPNLNPEPPLNSEARREFDLSLIHI